MALHGLNAELAVDAIKARAARLAVDKGREDGRKLALVAEGGAMRAIISCGAMLGLEELGLTTVFDEVYAASAGAANAAYFLAGQAAYAVPIYYRDINNTRFLKSAWNRKMVDIDYLFDEVITHIRPLRLGKVLESPSRLYAVIGDATTARAFVVDVQSSDVSLLTILKASSAMPLLYNETIEIDGRGCFDGGMINPVPIIEAVENGCTDILVLLTRPASFREVPPTRFEQDLFNRRCACGNTALTDAFSKSYIHSNYLRDVVLGRNPILEKVNIATICPAEGEPTIEWTERDAALLKNAAISSARRTFETFGYFCDEFIEVLRSFPYIPREISPLETDRKIPA